MTVTTKIPHALMFAACLGWTGLAGLPAAAAAETLAKEQVIRAGLAFDDIRTLDPHTAVADGEVPIVSELYEGLVAFPPGSMDVRDLRPGLAESWVSNTETTEWTFTLRKGVKWHDGSDFTSDDVKFSLERVLDPKVGSPFRGTIENIQSVDATAPLTVKVILKFPDPAFPQLMVGYQAGYIVSRKAATSGDIRLAPVGTGPFKLSSYNARESVTLVRNDAYWGGKPIIEQVVYQFMPEASTRELALKAGEVNLIGIQARQDVVDRVRKSAKVDLTTPANSFYLFLNATKKPLDDIRVRQALAYATDRANLIKFLGADIAQPETSALPKGYVGHTDDVAHYDFDIAKAKDLLKAAGHPDGFQLSVNMSNSNIYLPPMQVIQEQWKKIGVAVDIKVVDHPTYHRLIREDANPLIIYGAFRYPLTGRIYLNQFYSGASAIGKPTAIVNFSHFGDAVPGADDALSAADRTSDGNEQIRLWGEAQRTIADQAVVIPLYTQYYAMARAGSVDLGFEQKSLSFYSITEKTRILEK